MSQYNNQKKAVALKYDENQHAAPVIVASGLGHMAEKIVETAVENNVPVFEDSSLSTVLSQLDLGAEIPEELYQAVVDIYIYFLNYLPGQKIPMTGEKPAAELYAGDGPQTQTEPEASDAPAPAVEES